MNPNIEQKLHGIQVKHLSVDEERLVWGRIKTELPKTPGHSLTGEAPILSPLSPSISFFSHRAVIFAAVFLIILGTVSAADSAHPQSVLFPLDLAVERVESAIDPKSRAEHARERVEEFDLVFAQDGDNATEEATIGMRMQKDDAALAPPATNEAVFEMTAFSVANDSAETQSVLSPEMQMAIDTTRRELARIMAEATLRGDIETLQEIQMTIDGFEALVEDLR